ncbi:hypothetical protein [Photobacterium sanguinicancri]|uniref:hypothetical protein n=1 Tax=Photobacterium sanguinicancri TaxID=875932 RepID=UPI0021C459AA|nr:hypothetical protein [Photobacterium sanguinicancri]
MFDTNKANPILTEFGFELKNTSGFGDDYRYELGNGWEVTAYCSFVGNPFANNVDHTKYEEVNIHLFDCIGTEYICKSVDSLKEKLAKVVETLKSNSDDDDILKCPECNRYVGVKRPTRGQKWKPFLSCKGMIVQGRGKNKDVLCRGVSKKLRAEVIF